MKFYAFEKGACRGEVFVNEVEFESDVIVGGIIHLMFIVDNGDEEVVDCYKDNLYDVLLDQFNNDHIKATIGYKIIVGEEEFKGVDAMSHQHRMENLMNGESFCLELEESTIGIGKTLDAAKFVYVDCY